MTRWEEGASNLQFEWDVKNSLVIGVHLGEVHPKLWRPQHDANFSTVYRILELVGEQPVLFDTGLRLHYDTNDGVHIYSPPYELECLYNWYRSKLWFNNCPVEKAKQYWFLPSGAVHDVKLDNWNNYAFNKAADGHYFSDVLGKRLCGQRQPKKQWKPEAGTTFAWIEGRDTTNNTFDITRAYSKAPSNRSSSDRYFERPNHPEKYIWGACGSRNQCCHRMCDKCRPWARDENVKVQKYPNVRTRNEDKVTYYNHCVTCRTPCPQCLYPITFNEHCTFRTTKGSTKRVYFLPFKVWPSDPTVFEKTQQALADLTEVWLVQRAPTGDQGFEINKRILELFKTTMDSWVFQRRNYQRSDQITERTWQRSKEPKWNRLEKEIEGLLDMRKLISDLQRVTAY